MFYSHGIDVLRTHTVINLADHGMGHGSGKGFKKSETELTNTSSVLKFSESKPKNS